MAISIKEMWCQECNDMKVHHIFDGFNGIWCKCMECAYQFFINEYPHDLDPDYEGEDNADILT